MYVCIMVSDRLATVHKTRFKVVENPQRKPSPPLYPQRPMFWPPPHASWRTRPVLMPHVHAPAWAVNGAWQPNVGGPTTSSKAHAGGGGNDLGNDRPEADVLRT